MTWTTEFPRFYATLHFDENDTHKRGSRHQTLREARAFVMELVKSEPAFEFGIVQDCETYKKWIWFDDGQGWETVER